MQSLWPKLQLYYQDWLFLSLFITFAVILCLTLLLHHPVSGSSPMPLTLVLLFSFSNIVFAFFAFPRDALLAYLFLSAAVVLVCILFFFSQALANS